MYILFFLIWIILNGRITIEIIIFGIFIASILYYFICHFMDYSIKKDLFIMSRIGLIIQYIITLVIEIVKANIEVLQLVFSSKYECEPIIIRFRTNLKTKIARVVLANSITLTPGTITVSLEDNEYVVHCLDKNFSVGIDTSVLVRLLEKMEGKYE